MTMHEMRLMNQKLVVQNFMRMFIFMILMMRVILMRRVAMKR
jgi:hypothetical protein